MVVCECVDQNENKHLHMIGRNDGEVVYCGVLGCDALESDRLLLPSKLITYVLPKRFILHTNQQLRLNKNVRLLEPSECNLQRKVTHRQVEYV
jgi:hypothetical protein